LKNLLFWHITQCKQSFACSLLHVDFLHGLPFNPEQGSDMFLCNVGWLSADYTALFLHNHRCNNLKSKKFKY
jgi:hypothetical protein